MKLKATFEKKFHQLLIDWHELKSNDFLHEIFHDFVDEKNNLPVLSRPQDKCEQAKNKKERLNKTEETKGREIFLALKL